MCALDGPCAWLNSAWQDGHVRGWSCERTVHTAEPWLSGLTHGQIPTRAVLQTTGQHISKEFQNHAAKALELHFFPQAALHTLPFKAFGPTKNTRLILKNAPPENPCGTFPQIPPPAHPSTKQPHATIIIISLMDKQSNFSSILLARLWFLNCSGNGAQLADGLMVCFRSGSDQYSSLKQTLANTCSWIPKI